MGLRAGSVLINPSVVLSSMPPIRVASTSSHPGSYLWNESSFNLHKHTKARDSNAPYASAMDVYRRSGDANCNDSFEDLGNVFVKLMTQHLADKLILGLHDMIGATKRVSRKKLDSLQLTDYQAGLLSRGVQYLMDRMEPYNMVVEASVGYAGSVGVAAFDEIASVNEKVGIPFSWLRFSN